MLLSGDADVKVGLNTYRLILEAELIDLLQHFASSTSIDRKIRRHTDRKTGLAIEQLRQNYESLLQTRLSAPSAPLTDVQASWFALLQESLTFNDKSNEVNGLQDRDRIAVNVVKR